MAVILSGSLSGMVYAQDGEAASGAITGHVDHPMLRRWSAAVYVVDAPGQEESASGARAVMDQVNLRFTPHILVTQAGTTIDFPNSDETRHNVYTSERSPCTFELGVYDPGVVKHVTCDDPGIITLMCNVHAEMRGYIVVTPTPWGTVTNPDGMFEITNLPTGTHRIALFHERLEADPVDVEVLPDSTVRVDFDTLSRRRRTP